MTLLSIIVPIYNVENFLDKCIKSLINQTLKDIEIILVNDGSTDLSPQICDEYAKKDSRIKLIHKTNGGLSDARNVGLEIAKGKYIAFLDSDDWIEPRMYEYLYKIAHENSSDIAQCEFVKAYTEDTSIDKTIVEDINIYDGQTVMGHLYGDDYVKTVVVWNKIYKRSLFDTLKFPEGKVHEDEFTTYKLFYNANNVVDTNIPMVYYRQREGSIMNSEFNIKRLDALEAWRERREYFSKHGLHQLQLKTESLICGNLKNFYIRVNQSTIEDKNKILKDLKKEMRNNYINFIRNKEISIKGKITLTVCILNEKMFLQIYNKYSS